jgi:Fic family protein
MGHSDGTHRYLESHEWLKFEISLRDMATEFWMLLGEARSKCDHLSGVPIDEATTRKLNQVYFAKGLNATTAIEGNTLTEDEVRRKIEGEDLQLPKSKEYLEREIENMLDAYNGIIHRLRGGDQVPLDVSALCALNKQILDGLELGEPVVPGEIRTYSVTTGPYRGAPWIECERLLTRLCDWLESEAFVVEFSTASHLRVPIAFIKAVVAHVYVEWIHAFGDGNGRLGRLVEFQILISSGIPQAAAHVLTSHYNDTRTEYYRQLNRASDNGGDLREFLMYAAQGFVDGLGKQLTHIKDLQEMLMWRAHVDQEFLWSTSQAAFRQRALVIALAEAREPVSTAKLRVLTPELADAYLGKTNKTLTRDINRLKSMGFVATRRGYVRARTEILAGFRSFHVEP